MELPSIKSNYGRLRVDLQTVKTSTGRRRPLVESGCDSNVSKFGLTDPSIGHRPFYKPSYTSVEKALRLVFSDGWSTGPSMVHRLF